MWKHFGMQTCSSPRMPAVQEGNHMEWRLWNGPICVLELILKWAYPRYYMGKYEEYCKPQSNEVQARFDLLMSFRQGNCSVCEWYNTMQAQVNLAKYPLETAKILHRDIFCFFLKDEIFVSGPSVMAVLTWTNSLQVECANWPKNMKAQKLQQDT